MRYRDGESLAACVATSLTSTCQIAKDCEGLLLSETDFDELEDSLT